MSSRFQTNTPVQLAAKFVRLSQLRKLRECEQVAAVCYRVRRESVEFLLVRTRGAGRWTFPKGNAEPGMTHAHAAALEAFEEAGVHGRIEEASFGRYFARKRILNSNHQGVDKKMLVNAHLCEVLRLGAPKESNRRRTWFSFETASESLQEGRKRDEAAALVGVLKKAVERINLQEQSRMATGTSQRNIQERPAQKDSLNQVFFERTAERMVAPRIRSGEEASARMTYPPRKYLECEVLPFARPFDSKKKPKALSDGTRD